MKRLTSLVLALLLALTMMVGAFAETADVTGEWYGELLGIQVTLTINADGTYKMDIAGMDSEEGVWEKNEDGNLVMDKGTEGEGLVTVTETGLSTEQDGMKIDFTREAPAEDEELTISTETTEEELQGKWQATSVIMNGMSVPMSMVGQECIIEVKDSNLVPAESGWSDGAGGDSDSDDVCGWHPHCDAAGGREHDADVRRGEADGRHGAV